MVEIKAMQEIMDVPEGPVLVIAPHNDDEVLGAGGALQRHMRRGERITVALLTNGDGQYRGPFKNRAQAIRFGYRRQQESLRALACLGVHKDRVLFLGYPDRGLAQLWNHHWEDVYRSPQTRLDHSPYENSFTPHAPYCGLSVVEDLKKILKAERPSTIYLPHPYDLHPDHWSAHAFTLYALESLKLEHPEGGYGKAHLLCYLVHYGRWPKPRGKFIDAPLKLPGPLVDLDAPWWSLPLTRQETLKKYRAILCYRSQVKYMRLYLSSFARRNELFGEVPTLTLKGALGLNGKEEFLSPLNPTELKGASVEEQPMLRYFDPQHRSLLKNLQGHGNGVRAVRLAIAEKSSLKIEVEFFKPLRSPHEALIHLKTIGAPAPAAWQFVKRDGEIFLNGRSLKGGPFSCLMGQSSLSLSLPLEVLGGPKAFLIGVELRRKGITFAKSAYRLVEVAQPPLAQGMSGQRSIGSVERTICMPASANR